MILGLELVVAADLSLAGIFMACRGSGVRVSLAPFIEAQSLTGFFDVWARVQSGQLRLELVKAIAKQAPSGLRDAYGCAFSCPRCRPPATNPSPLILLQLALIPVQSRTPRLDGVAELGGNSRCYRLYPRRWNAVLKRLSRRNCSLCRRFWRLKQAA